MIYTADIPCNINKFVGIKTIFYKQIRIFVYKVKKTVVEINLPWISIENQKALNDPYQKP